VSQHDRSTERPEKDYDTALEAHGSLFMRLIKVSGALPPRGGVIGWMGRLRPAAFGRTRLFTSA